MPPPSKQKPIKKKNNDVIITPIPNESVDDLDIPSSSGDHSIVIAK